MTEIKTKGLAELQKMLNTLPAKMEKNILRGAMRAGAKPVLAAAKQGAAVASGELRDSLRITDGVKKGNRSQVYAAVTTAKKVKRGQVDAAGASDAFYAKFVEFGTDPHLIKVEDNEKPRYVTRRGTVKKQSMKTINKMVKTGSLVIGKNFVGPVVSHPGAKPHPFMRPALDTQAGAAVTAAGEYIKKRLTKEGLDASGVDVEVEE